MATIPPPPKKNPTPLQIPPFRKRSSCWGNRGRGWGRPFWQSGAPNAQAARAERSSKCACLPSTSTADSDSFLPCQCSDAPCDFFQLLINDTACFPFPLASRLALSFWSTCLQISALFQAPPTRNTPKLFDFSGFLALGAAGGLQIEDAREMRMYGQPDHRTVAASGSRRNLSSTVMFSVLGPCKDLVRF